MDIATHNYAIDARAQIAAQTGLLRLVFERANHRLGGIHGPVERAADSIGEGAPAVRIGVTLEQLAQTIHPHPTPTAAVGLLARQTLTRLQTEGKQAQPAAAAGATHD
jgi:dihydrolipoamide dehydrogenase